MAKAASKGKQGKSTGNSANGNSANGKKRKAEASSAKKKNQKSGKNDDVRKRPKTKPTGKGGKGGAKGPKILSEYELQEGYDPEVSDQDLDFVESLGKSAHGSSFLQALGSTDFRPGVDREEEEDDIIERYESKPRKIQEDQTKEAKEEEKKKHRVPLLPVKNEAGALEKAIEVVEAKKRAPSAAPKEQADSKDSKNATTKAAATAGKQQQKKERVPEDFPSIKRRIAVCSVSTIENPEGKGEECLDVLLQYARSQDPKVCQIAMLSLQAIFKDILPTYKIKSIDETDLNLTKEVRRQHKFEGMLLRTYQQFLRILFKKSRSGFDQVKVSSCKCLSSLLKANYNFNYRSDILKQMVPMMNSRVKEVSTLALDCISSLFMIDKEGEATLESLQLVADFVRKNDCMLNGKIIESLKGIRLRHDLSRKLLQAEEDDSVHIGRKEKQRRALEKRRKRDAALADGKDVDYHLGSATQGVKEKIKYQTKIVEAMFECIFRVLKNFKDGISEMEDGADTDKYFHWPLLSAALSCLAKYCAHINIDFMKDLFNWLYVISTELCVPKIQKFQCLNSVYQILDGPGKALNIDTLRFDTALYDILLKEKFLPRGASDELQLPENLCAAPKAIQMALLFRRVMDRKRVINFMKRMSMCSLHEAYSEETLCSVHLVARLLQRYSSTRALMENDEINMIYTNSDFERTMDLHGKDTCSLWELSLLKEHYHPHVASSVSTILSNRPSELLKDPSNVLNVNDVSGVCDEYSTVFGAVHPAPKPPKNTYKKYKVKPDPGAEVLAEESFSELNLKKDLFKHYLQSRGFL